MVRNMKIAAVAGGALILSALPVFAQGVNPLGIDLDPFHIFTPAPPPPGPIVAPEPVAPPPGHHHHHWHHHVHHHHHHHHAHKG